MVKIYLLVKTTSTNLERDVVLFSNVPRQVNDSLHALYLTFDISVKVLFFHFGEAQEMNRTRVALGGILWNVFPKRLVEIFS